MGTQEEDQEGSSAEQRDNKGPEGSNAPSKPERQDMRCPSITDTAPPYIVVEMHMMRERMDFMMHTLKGRVSRNLNKLVHQTESPFTAPVTSFPIPLQFRMLQVENYDENKDPLDHLESFKTLMQL